MACREISDHLWSQVAPLLGPFKRKRPGGSKPLDLRNVLNGILHVLTAGRQWECLPPAYGSKSAVHEHFQRWTRAGVFAEICRLCAEECGEAVGYEWAWQSMDGSTVQAPVRQSVCLAEEGLGRNPTDCGRTGSKTHPLVEAAGMPAGVALAGDARRRGPPRRRPRAHGGAAPKPARLMSANW